MTTPAMSVRPTRAGRAAHSATATLAVLLALAVGCSSSKKANTTTTTTTSAATTTVATTTTIASGASTTAGVPGAPVGVEPWVATASDHAGHNGERFTYTCPAGGTIGRIWGTETYTDDSSVCSAAVHVGLITTTAGGSVEIEIAPGLASYKGRTAHGATSSGYGSWGGSFIFPAKPPGSGSFPVGAESWTENAQANAGKIGAKVVVTCAANGTPGKLFGSGPYTDDSSVCTAGVHAGVITISAGGDVVIVIGGAESTFSGTTANGVTSSSYGAWGGSFTIPKDQKTEQ